MTTSAPPRLAIDGGSKAVTLPFPSTLHGVSEIGQEEIDAVERAMRRTTIWRFLNPPDVSESTELERRWREMTGAKHALAVGSGGTGALVAALVGLGIGSGDEVIVPGYTYIATASACLLVGAIPILAEVDESLTLDPRDVERKITTHTRAIIPVHMRGSVCDLDAILDIARRNKLKVLEDCAQACGATYKDRFCGTVGDAGAFSMQHFKMITAGEGGIVTTRDENVWKRAAVRHDSALQFWKPDTTWPTFAGDNYRMDEMRAALALAQLDRLPRILARCRQIKQALHARLGDLPGVRLQTLHDPAGDCGIVFAMFLKDGDHARRFSEALTAEGCRNGTIYNREIPDRHIYTAWDYVLEKHTHDPSGWPWTAARRPIAYQRDMLPQTLDVLGRCVAIPISQHWSDELLEQVVSAVRKVSSALG
jgi:8-amino-3,8-dideoxy-alpha-D-manno-octulosonate transaminase